MESPVILQQTIENCKDQAMALADRFRSCSLFFLLGRGANYPTALEGALKLKESCNIMAEGHAAREFLHGPMQLVDGNTPVITIATRADIESIEPLTQSFRRLGAPVVHISDAAAAEPGDWMRVAEGLSESLSPLAFIAPLQLFAYHSAVVRGLDPDKPTKLAKVVR
jgi:glucosamine--fructose-6-phosphate aminotransferase (isomerizing)